MSPRILLFDIDGTLLLTNSAGRITLERALAAEFGLEDIDVDIDFAGRTDRALLDEILERNALPKSEAWRQRLANRFESMLPGVLEQRGGQVLPGVIEVLQRISELDGVCSYVMTGNMQATGAIKLRHFDLDRYFLDIFGGNLDATRPELARRTAEQIVNLHGQQAVSEMVVVGDTPDDIECGHAIGARVIAVCTGFSDRPTLEAHQPLVVLDDLSDVPRVINYLTS